MVSRLANDCEPHSERLDIFYISHCGYTVLHIPQVLEFSQKMRQPRSIPQDRFLQRLWLAPCFEASGINRAWWDAEPRDGHMHQRSCTDFRSGKSMPLGRLLMEM